MSRFFMLRKISLILFIVFLSGCTVSLTEKGRAVRVINSDQKQSCEYLDTITSSNDEGWDSGDDQMNALNEVKNKAALSGGNAIYILNSSTSISAIPVGNTVAVGSEAVIQAETYRCLFKTKALSPI